MNFIGVEFLYFFLIVFVLYWVFPNRRWQNVLLFTASLVFYGWLTAWHTLVLLASIAVDYFLALAMPRWKTRSSLLMWLGIILNIGLIASVKYYLNFDDALAEWSLQTGFGQGFLLSTILLPLGVSFFTLKKIAYLVDVNRSAMPPVKDFIAFGAYVSFFPQVFSGPIDRPQAFLKQLEEPRTWAMDHIYNAWQLIVMGLFKKIVIANTVKVIVDQIFLMREPSKIFLIVGGLGFTLQILADFSSYTDLSRGIAFLLGLKTSENFNKPYISQTPNDFWNRWHMSFSFWLRDYIFFPVRRALMRASWLPAVFSQIVPPLITMFISGVWHGTGNTFIVWGLYYGVLIVIYQLLGVKVGQTPTKRFFAWLVMFMLIAFGWVIFRAPSTAWLWNALRLSPFANGPEEWFASLALMVMIAFYASLLFIKYILDEYFPKITWLHALYYAAALILTFVFMNSSTPDFIYFQF